MTSHNVQKREERREKREEIGWKEMMRWYPCVVRYGGMCPIDSFALPSNAFASGSARFFVLLQLNLKIGCLHLHTKQFKTLIADSVFIAFFAISLINPLELMAKHDGVGYLPEPFPKLLYSWEMQASFYSFQLRILNSQTKGLEWELFPYLLPTQLLE